MADICRAASLADIVSYYIMADNNTSTLRYGFSKIRCADLYVGIPRFRARPDPSVGSNLGEKQSYSPLKAFTEVKGNVQAVRGDNMPSFDQVSAGHEDPTE